MDNNNQKRRKNKKNYGNSFNMSNATKTFKKLIEKNKKEEKSKNKKIYFKKTDEFFNSLNNLFFKEEIKETDFDYIFREIKHRIKMNQKLVDMYGLNAPNKILPFSREPVRFDKKLLFNPLKHNPQKQTRYNSFSDKKENNLQLPCILKKNIKIINKRESAKSLFSKLESKKNIKKFSIIKTESSDFKFKDSDFNFTLDKEPFAPIKSYNFFSKTNNLLTLNNNSNNNSNTFNFENKSSFTVDNKSNSSFDKHEYLLTLDNLKDQIRHNQKRQKIYFKSNDYGCELFKNKYNYIIKKFFN